MGLFKKKQNPNLTPLIIYVAEDNPVYLRQLEFYLKKIHGDKILIESFPVSEVIEVKLEHGYTPDIILMDNFLGEKYKDATLGIDSLEQIQIKYPGITLILHSANHNLLTNETDTFHFIPKNDNAFQKISEVIVRKLG